MDEPAAQRADHASRRVADEVVPTIDQVLERTGIAAYDLSPTDDIAQAKRFTEELAQGAFFLLEDWTRHWDYVLTRTFGANERVIRDVFQGDRE
jgi:hypothetical protein